MSKDKPDDSTSSLESSSSFSPSIDDCENEIGSDSDDIEVLDISSTEEETQPRAQDPNPSSPLLLESNCFDDPLPYRPISPESEGFPLSPEWDDVDGFAVNIEESIVDVMEARRMEDEHQKGNNKNKKKHIKRGSKASPKRGNALRARKKTWNGIKKRPKSSAFAISSCVR